MNFENVFPSKVFGVDVNLKDAFSPFDSNLPSDFWDGDPEDLDAEEASPVVPPQFGSTVDKAGWLWLLLSHSPPEPPEKGKRSSIRDAMKDVVKNPWKRYWFALRGPLLEFYKRPPKSGTAPESNIRRGVIVLKGASVLPKGMSSKRRNVIEISFRQQHSNEDVSHRKFYVDCKSFEEKCSWLKKLAEGRGKPMTNGRSDVERKIQTLGLKRALTLSNVRQAFHKRALRCHPDKGGTTQMWKEVTEAYEVLLSMAEVKGGRQESRQS